VAAIADFMKQSSCTYITVDITTSTQFFNIMTWIMRLWFQGYNVNKGQVKGLPNGRYKLSVKLSDFTGTEKLSKLRSFDRQ
jgi:hypothetical protein